MLAKKAVQVFQKHSKGKQVTGIINGLPQTNKYLGPVIREIKRYWKELENIKTIKEEVEKQAVIMENDGKEKVSQELDNFKTEFQDKNKAIILELNPSIMTIINPVPGITGSLIKFILDNSTDPKVTSEKLYDEFLTIGKAAVEAAKKKALEADKKETTPATPATTTTTPADTTKTTEKPKEVPKTGQFGKSKRGPSASLKRMCKKHGVRLTVKRGKKRVYKSSKVLKEQCQRKLKKNFGRKKIKRYGIMPQKRKRRGKRKTTSKKRKTTMRQRLSAAADYARSNPGTIAGFTAGAGLSAAALNELQLAARRGYKARKNKKLLSIKPENMTEHQKKILEAYKAEQAALASPIYGGFTRGKKKAIFIRNALVGFSMLPYEDKKKVLSKLTKEQIESIKDAAEKAYEDAKSGGRSLRDRFTDLFKKKEEEEEELEYGKRRRRRRRRFGGQHEKCHHNYGKRRRRRRKSKYDFGKKAKKPSAALRRMCKRLKVRMTLKRGGKRVYKSESMLKKQCKKAMKRKSKK